MGNQKSNETLEKQYRKSLLITSVILLLYSIAGGSFKDGLSFFGSKMTFTRPEFLEYFAVILVLFFTWKHWLSSATIRKTFSNDLSIIKSFKHYPTNNLWAIILNDRIDSYDKCTFQVSINWFSKINIASHQFTTFGDEINIEINQNKQGYLCKASCCVIQIYHLIKTTVSKPEFGDGILPFIIALLALIAYIINKNSLIG